MKRSYRFEAATVAGLVQQLAVSYIGHGYYFYVTGEVSPRKEPAATDRAILSKYEPATSRATRSRRKAAGHANIHYLRYDRFFVILATEGKHEFFERERDVRDVRRTPILFRGYSISYTGGHPHVRLSEETFKEFKSYLLDIAVHRSVPELEAEFRARRYEPFAPVRAQVISVWAKVNEKRKLAGLELISTSCLYLWRKPLKVFTTECSASLEDWRSVA